MSWLPLIVLIIKGGPMSLPMSMKECWWCGNDAEEYKGDLDRFIAQLCTDCLQIYTKLNKQ